MSKELVISANRHEIKVGDSRRRSTGGGVISSGPTSIRSPAAFIKDVSRAFCPACSRPSSTWAWSATRFCMCRTFPKRRRRFRPRVGKPRSRPFGARAAAAGGAPAVQEHSSELSECRSGAAGGKSGSAEAETCRRCRNDRADRSRRERRGSRARRSVGRRSRRRRGIAAVDSRIPNTPPDVSRPARYARTRARCGRADLSLRRARSQPWNRSASQRRRNRFLRSARRIARQVQPLQHPAAG